MEVNLKTLIPIINSFTTPDVIMVFNEESRELKVFKGGLKMILNTESNQFRAIYSESFGGVLEISQLPKVSEKF